MEFEPQGAEQNKNKNKTRNKNHTKYKQKKNNKTFKAQREQGKKKDLKRSAKVCRAQDWSDAIATWHRQIDEDARESKGAVSRSRIRK